MSLEIIRNRVFDESADDIRRLLFVHGAGCAAWVWSDMLEWLADAGIPAAALSLRGHGGSDGHARLHRYRIRDYVDDVAGVIAGLPAPPVVAGHSMGGFVVQKLLETTSLPGAILLAPAPASGMLLDGLRMWRHWPGRVSLALWRRSLLTLYASEASARWFMFTEATDPALIRRTRERMQEESWRAILDMHGLDLPRPGKIAVPMLVLAGAKDHMFSVASNRRTAEAWGAQLEILAGRGHMFCSDAGWPDVARLIADWCARLPRASGVPKESEAP